jgi:MFS family permease
MESPRESPAPVPFDLTRILICVVAAIGFAFDIYELLMLPLIVGPALEEIARVSPGSAAANAWIGTLFYVPAIAGGVFGLLGGYLTDRFGRRRVLVWSILLYAVSAFAAGFSTNVWMLLILRTTTFIGVCVEFVAAVAWLAELFPNPRQREAVLGWTQAFSSLGGIMVTGAYYLAVRYQDELPAIHGVHSAWRYTLISGIIPAIPLIVIRPFLPESPAWAEKRAAGTLRRPSLAELFQPALRRTTIITCLMVAAGYGTAFGAIQQIPRIVPGLPEVAARVRTVLTDGLPELRSLPPNERAAALRKIAAVTRLPRDEQRDALRGIEELGLLPPEQRRSLAENYRDRVGRAVGKARQDMIADVQFFQEIGGLVGRGLLAILALLILSRRRLIRVFQIPSLLIVPLVFLFPAHDNLQLFQWGVFLCGLLTVAQFSFWGNYLPRVYPVHLRGTGESFAANIGGRMIGTSAAFVATSLATYMPGDSPPTQLAYAAAAVGTFTVIIGFILGFWLPEPRENVDE